MKWWNGESFDTQKWQIHLGPPDDESIQDYFYFYHAPAADGDDVWLNLKTGPSHTLKMKGVWKKITRFLLKFG